VRNLTETTALRNLRKGDTEALAFFIHKYTPYVTTVVYNIIGNSMDRADLEEVVSDVFVALWQNAELVHSPKGFLGTTARNKAKNKARELKLSLPLEDAIIVIDELDPEAQIEKRELSAAVKRAVLEMGQPEKDIFLRFYYYYQTLEEIAEDMRIPLSTVKTKLRRGRLKLKQTLARYIT
jgi:RNA polymerase sigma-70 factor (ECF subfamily)